jgi:hypothetical protein
MPGYFWAVCAVGVLLLFVRIKIACDQSSRSAVESGPSQARAQVQEKRVEMREYLIDQK